jgi:hypothetical protein
MERTESGLHDLSANRLIAESDEVAEALGSHLLSSHRQGRLKTVSDCRAAILDWCQSEEARELYGRDVLDGASYAVETMADELVGCLVRGLIEECTVSPKPRAA